MAAEQLKFNYLTWEIDTTGRYLLDEICHMSACHQVSCFDEYIMPHRDITFVASRKIHLCTVSVGMYRSLRRTRNGMVMKTNTEIVSLNNFLKWLNQCGNTPVVLMSFEPYEFAPYILLLALKRYDLLDKFKSVVYGFADVYAFIEKKCKKSVSSMSLQTLSKIFLNKNSIKSLDSRCRAELVNEILLHLAEDTDNPEQKVSEEMFSYISTVDEVDQRLNSKVKKIEIYSSLKPIFFPYLRLRDRSRRKRGLVLRNLLTHKSSRPVNYDTLKTMWSKGRDDFKKEIYALVSAPEKDIIDLVAVISYHFECKSEPNFNKVSLEEFENATKKLNLD